VVNKNRFNHALCLLLGDRKIYCLVNWCLVASALAWIVCNIWMVILNITFGTGKRKETNG
jgi:hypothetical protein